MSNLIGSCTYCGKTVRYGQAFCGYCGKPNIFWSIPDKTQCGNCHNHLEPGDKYCRICGTKVGEGAYEPYQDIMQCIYGPMPEERTHMCKRCGYKWETCLMIDDQAYCPKCGGQAPCQ